MAIPVLSDQDYGGSRKITNLPVSAANGEPVVHQQLAAVQATYTSTQSMTASGNITAWRSIVYVDCSAGQDITPTLPVADAAAVAGIAQITIVKIDGTLKADGSPTRVLPVPAAGDNPIKTNPSKDRVLRTQWEVITFTARAVGEIVLTSNIGKPADIIFNLTTSGLWPTKNCHIRYDTTAGAITSQVTGLTATDLGSTVTIVHAAGTNTLTLTNDAGTIVNPLNLPLTSTTPGICWHFKGIAANAWELLGVLNTGGTSSSAGTIAGLSALRSLATPTDSSKLYELSYRASAGDVQMPQFWWNASDTRADNDGTIIRPTAIAAGNPGRYNAVLNLPYIHAGWFGAGNSSTAPYDTGKLNAAIAFAKTSIPVVYCPKATYWVDAPIWLANAELHGVSLLGDGTNQTKFRNINATNAPVIGIDGVSGQPTNITVRGISVETANIGIGYAFFVKHANFADFYNCYALNCASGTRLVNDTAGRFSEFITYTDCEFHYCTDDISFEQIAPGDASFHGVSFARTTCNVRRGQTAIKQRGGVVYQSDWDIQIFTEDDATIIDTTGDLYQTRGNIRVEGFQYNTAPNNPKILGSGRFHFDGVLSLFGHAATVIDTSSRIDNIPVVLCGNYHSGKVAFTNTNLSALTPTMGGKLLGTDPTYNTFSAGLFHLGGTNIESVGVSIYDNVAANGFYIFKSAFQTLLKNATPVMAFLKDGVIQGFGTLRLKLAGATFDAFWIDSTTNRARGEFGRAFAGSVLASGAVQTIDVAGVVPVNGNVVTKIMVNLNSYTPSSFVWKGSFECQIEGWNDGTERYPNQTGFGHQVPLTGISIQGISVTEQGTVKIRVMTNQELFWVVYSETQVNK